MMDCAARSRVTLCHDFVPTALTVQIDARCSRATITSIIGILVIVVLTLTHGYNAVCSHRTGSNDSGAEDYLRRVLVVEGYHAQHDKNPNCSLFNYYLCPEISTTFG